MSDLHGRAVVITGAGRGMGAGIATAAFDAGASIALVDVIAGSAEAVAARLDPSGRRAVGLTGDVRLDGDVDRVLGAAVDRFDGPDAWVNNAGIIEMSPAIDTLSADFDAHLAVNTTAVFRCCQAAARYWRATGRAGAIVNIASFAGKVGYPEMIAYNVSEWAADGINVNCICPSGVDTPMLDAVAAYHAGEGDPAPIRATMLAGDLGRTITPLEIGRVVAFLLSDDARVIRGQAISVDGGDSPY